MPGDFEFEMAVDVGNSAAKFWFLDNRREPIDQNGDWFVRVSVGDMSGTNWLDQTVDAIFRDSSIDRAIQWWISSVNKSAAALLTDAIEKSRPRDRFMVLSSLDVPIAINVDHPERVGTDRLLAAAAAVQLKQDGRSAIVVDAGSAITCDYVSESGVYQGGAILAGFEMQWKALSRDTAQLPLVDATSTSNELTPIGKSTVAAIRGGVGLGIVGAIRELINRISELAPDEPQLFFTGGDMRELRSLAKVDSVCLPHLVAIGIATTARHLQSNAKT